MAVMDRAPSVETTSSMLEAGIDSIQRVEALLQRLLNEATNERFVLNIGQAMRHLALARMQLESPGWQDKRAHARTRESAVILVEAPNHLLIEAALHDISPGGALIECDEPLEEGVNCRMSLPGLDEWVDARSCGSRSGFTRLAFDPDSIKSLLPLVKHLDRRFDRY